MHKTMVVVAIALAIGGSALSTSAFARGGGGHGVGGGFGGSRFGESFVVGRMAGGGYDLYGNRVSDFHGGFDRGDVWGHWGRYYGPMIPVP